MPMPAIVCANPLKRRRSDDADDTDDGFSHCHVRNLIASGGRILVDGARVMIEGPDALTEALQPYLEGLAAQIVPGVSAADAAQTKALLARAAVSILYVTDPKAAQKVVAAMVASSPAVVGLDMETEVLPEFRQPRPVAFTKAGRPCTRQPSTGEAGAALDPFMSKVRLLQAHPLDGSVVFVFDMRQVTWPDLRPLFALPLAVFNATFEVKRLLHEAKIEPSGEIFDVLTACRLSDGVRPSLRKAMQDYYGVDIPKTLGASDWSADVLSLEQVEYAALDAVCCQLLWYTQQREMFDEQDKSCQRLADRCVIPVACMELQGMPIDAGALCAFIAQWEVDQRLALHALEKVSPGRDLTKPGPLRDHLQGVLTPEELIEWPRTATGLLSTDKKVLQINEHIPGIRERLLLTGLKTLLNTFGEPLLRFIHPLTGRLHASFQIAGARTSRFSSKSKNPNMQQMPKAKMKSFRRVFHAPTGQVMVGADYSQIELRVVAELISAHFRRPSILRQAFARGVDAHTATAMAMTGKKDVTTEERQMAKICNFGLLYRMGNRGFFNYVRAGFKPDITFDEARDLRAKFFAGYPDMELWQKEYSDLAREQGFAATVGGRRWKWEWGAKSEDELDPDTPFYEDALEGFNGAIAVNFPVQGTAAEIMQDALCRIHNAIRDEPAELIATIHDEVLLLVADDPVTVKRVGAIIQREMIAAFVEVFPDAPTINLVSPAVGPTWGDLQPLPIAK